MVMDLPFKTITAVSYTHLTASKYYDFSGYQWNDAAWFKNKEKHPHYEQPVNIYEIHLGSWKRYQDGHVFSYEKIADELIPYIKEMGYTHIELMPITCLLYTSRCV